jgi:hypothetical protein
MASPCCLPHLYSYQYIKYTLQRRQSHRRLRKPRWSQVSHRKPRKLRRWSWVSLGEWGSCSCASWVPSEWELVPVVSPLGRGYFNEPLATRTQSQRSSGFKSTLYSGYDVTVTEQLQKQCEELLCQLARGPSCCLLLPLLYLILFVGVWIIMSLFASKICVLL